MFERRLYYSHRLGPHRVRWLALCAIGLIDDLQHDGRRHRRLYWTQIYAIGLGLVAMVAA
jgi:hypothetical protein